MSAKTVRAWADSGAVVVYDTLDTCQVHVPYCGDTLFYSVDALRGIIVDFYWYNFNAMTNVTQSYFYGYDKGVYYLQRVAGSSLDTGIESGGYIFTNVRINGQPVTSVTGGVRPEKTPFAIHALGNGIDRLTYSGAEEGMRLRAFDPLGRSLFETRLPAGGGVLNLDRLCGRSGCRSGPLVIRMNGPFQQAFFYRAVAR
jgi:hypothetical protein